MAELSADESFRDENGNTAINLAAIHGKLDVILLLVTEFGFSPHTKGQLDRTPLHQACVYGHVDVVRKLKVEFGADLNARDSQDNTPINLAAMYGKMDVFCVLANEFGCSPHTKGQLDRTPLHQACVYGHEDVVRKLKVEFGADLNARDSQDNTPINLAAMYGRMDVFRVLANEFGCSPHTKGLLDRTPLHQACVYGHVDIVRKLKVEFGADLNARDSQDNTPINLAAICGKVDVFRVLANEFGCSPHTKGQLGRTPLHQACIHGHVDVVRRLKVEFGAVGNVKYEGPAVEPEAEEPKAEEPKAEEPKAEEPKAEEPKAEELKAEKPKAEELEPEELEPEELEPEELKPEELEPEELEPEELKPEDPEPPAVPVEPPSWVVDRQEVELKEEISRGGWAVVRVAHFRGLRVAAKCLHRQIISDYNIRLFKREMSVASQVHHPNLLQFLGATLEGEPLILTELMPTSLRAVLGQRALSRGQVVSIGRDVASALNYLHLMRPDPVLHRDISSANVLLEPSGTDNSWKAKVSDFGSANYQQHLETIGPGSPAYAAPEANNPARQSPKMDVFSYGVLLLEMASREMPEGAERRRELLEEMEWAPVAGVVRDCTEKEPERRPDMAAILKQLNNL